MKLVSVKNKIWDQVYNQLWNQVSDQLWNQVNNNRPTLTNKSATLTNKSPTVDNTSNNVEYTRMNQLLINPILVETDSYYAIIRGYLNPSLLNVIDVRSCWIAFFARFRQISLDFYVDRGYDWL
jgi:hypothetical protein